MPGGPGIRDDSSLYEGYEVPIYYDPMISKLVAWGPDRDTALSRMRRALQEYKVVGIATTIPLFQRIIEDPAFIAGDFNTGYLDALLQDGALGPDHDRHGEIDEVAALAAASKASRLQHAISAGAAGIGMGEPVTETLGVRGNVAVEPLRKVPPRPAERLGKTRCTDPGIDDGTHDVAVRGPWPCEGVMSELHVATSATPRPVWVERAITHAAL